MTITVRKPEGDFASYLATENGFCDQCGLPVWAWVQWARQSDGTYEVEYKPRIVFHTDRSAAQEKRCQGARAELEVVNS